MQLAPDQFLQRYALVNQQAISAQTDACRQVHAKDNATRNWCCNLQ